jgi:hypothetical protein
MTIMMTSDMPGITQADYELLAAALLPLLQAADGFIAHAAGPVEGGYQVTEVWESEAAHSAWVTAHVIPALPPGTTPPIITTRPITKIATRA